MQFLVTLYNISLTIIDNMFNRRWWYVWFFQVAFILILLERTQTEPQNANLCILMIAWSTIVVTLLNVEASYSDYVAKLLKRTSYMNMAKATMSDTNAD